MLVRKANVNDLERIIEIFNQAIEWGQANAYTETFSIDERREWFELHSGEKYIVLVAEVNKRVEGFLSISPYRQGRQAFQSTAEVAYYVDFDHHREGIASAMIEIAFAHCRHVDVDVLLAFLYDHNKTSISFLKKHGFEKWGLFPGAAVVKEEVYDHAVYGRKLSHN